MYLNNPILFIETSIPQYVIPNICDYYTVRTDGLIVNKLNGNSLPKNQNYNKDKYITISLKCKDGTNVYAQPHRIVLMTFNYIQGCEQLEVNHKDGIKYHNWISNLEWCTHNENMKHAFRNNLVSIGEDRTNSIFTEEDVINICELISKNVCISDIANMYKCSRSAINNIKIGHCWNRISSKYNFDNKYNFTIEQINQICKYFEEFGRGKTYKEVLDYINYDYENLSYNELCRLNTSISNIINKNTYKDICINYDY